MIQRIQTVFLLFAIISMGMFLYMPVISMESHNYYEDIRGYNVLHFYMGYLFFINAILTGTALVITLLNIFMYNRRGLQKALCWVAVLFIAAAQVYILYKYENKIFIGDVILRKWNIFSLSAIACEIIAYYFIRKDEKLVNSMDRLR